MAKQFFKLPYIGPFSPLAQRKIKIIAKTYCNMFSVIPNTLHSQLVYKFTCAGCRACYVGEVTRHFSTAQGS